MVRVEFHPTFAGQYEQLCLDEAAAEIAGEVTQLIDALETYGHEIEGDAPDDPSHPVVTSLLESTMVPEWERVNRHHRARVRRSR